MSIILLQTMQWTKLNWLNSFNPVLELKTILPRVGQRYPLTLSQNEAFPSEGTAYVLWTPPHSELNGWYDKRPSEILKSYVLQGNLSASKPDGLNFHFDIQSIMLLTKWFDDVAVTTISPLYTCGNSAGPSFMLWDDCYPGSLIKAKVGEFWYLHGVSDETFLEIIFSHDKETFCVHYSAYLPNPANYETQIVRYYPTQSELEVLKKVITCAATRTDNSGEQLSKDQVLGAEYY